MAYRYPIDQRAADEEALFGGADTEIPALRMLRYLFRRARNQKQYAAAVAALAEAIRMTAPIFPENGRIAAVLAIASRIHRSGQP